MKIAYTISGIYNSGGMENILLQKVNYLANVLGYDITIITTDQDHRPCFFHKSDKVRHLDLGINYYKYKNSRLWHVKKMYLKRIHKKRLDSLLRSEQFDISISLMDFDFSFLYKIKDKSKKIVEFHFQRYYKVNGTKNRLKQYLQYIRTCSWKKTISRYDKFIVLTNEDKEQWGDLDNICVIPNFTTNLGNLVTDISAKRIISVGRADYQKGFDVLIQAWKDVNREFPEWELAIYGGGQKEELMALIKKLNLEKSVMLYPATNDIKSEYLKSSVYVLSSRYEGLPLVLLEAMSYGLPIVSFSCPCGPKDIVKQDFGILVKPKDVKGLSEAMIDWIRNPEKRLEASRTAFEEAKKYRIDNIMKYWEELFKSL